MSQAVAYVRVASLKSADAFRRHLSALGIALEFDETLEAGPEAPLARPCQFKGRTIGNRFCVLPMEGWDGTRQGEPSDLTVRRWRRFGQSGAKLIWGGEAVAVRHDGRANPNQLVIAPHTERGLAHLREVLIEEHRSVAGSDDGLLIGLQLTHSGRYSRPGADHRGAPRVLYRHPILDRRLELTADFPVLTDQEVGAIIEDFHRAARTASRLGFDFVDVKHCHGYLGHEFLSAHTREGRYGGSFENRTRFLREVVQGIRSLAPGLGIAVRLSAFDTVPFQPDPERSLKGKPGPGIPETQRNLIPYRWGFGVDALNPTEADLSEPVRFLALLEALEIRLVNLTAGSPYYNPHIQRPALYPPSDGYLPPEDPLVGVSRQMEATRRLKEQFPELIIVGSGYSYLQDFLPYVAQAAGR